MKEKVIEYLESQVNINQEILESFDQKLDIKDVEIIKLRELERIKLNDRILEIKRHIKVISILSEKD